MPDLVHGDDGRARCGWCGDDPEYRRYHDEEWGEPLRGDRELFEKISLEGFQAGLSWITILRRRPTLRAAFAGFDIDAVAAFDDADVDRLMADPGIIRNRLKLKAVRQNAQAWLKLEDPVTWLWSFVGGAPKINHFSDRSQMLAVTPEAEAMSKALRKAGFNFVGPTICYAFMQATGMVMDHTTDCDRYAQLKGS